MLKYITIKTLKNLNFSYLAVNTWEHKFWPAVADVLDQVSSGHGQDPMVGVQDSVGILVNDAQESPVLLTVQDHVKLMLNILNQGFNLHRTDQSATLRTEPVRMIVQGLLW